jgi:hypothetical protein
MEVYHKRQMTTLQEGDRPDRFAIKWVDPMGLPLEYADKVYTEADRLFRAYREVYPPGEFGEIKAVEAHHRVENFYGCPTFDIRPDLECYLNEEEAEKWGVEAGWYLPDHKFLSAVRSDDVVNVERDLRFAVYPLAYKAAHPERDVKGVIVNIIYKKKIPEFKKILVDYPSEEKIKMVANTLQRAAAIREEQLAKELPDVRTTMCSDRWGQCKFFNQCRRY